MKKNILCPMKASDKEMWFGLRDQGSALWGRTYLS